MKKSCVVSPQWANLYEIYTKYINIPVKITDSWSERPHGQPPETIGLAKYYHPPNILEYFTCDLPNLSKSHFK